MNFMQVIVKTEWTDPALTSCNRKKGRAGSKPRSLYYSSTEQYTGVNSCGAKKENMLYVHCEICYASLEGQRARRFPTFANACCVLFVSGFPMFILTGKKWGPGLLCGPCEACQAFQNLDPDYSRQSMDDMTYECSRNSPFTTLSPTCSCASSAEHHMFQILWNILPEFRQRFAKAYSPWPRASPNRVAFVMSHVFSGCSPSAFWTYVTYVSNLT